MNLSGQEATNELFSCSDGDHRALQNEPSLSSTWNSISQSERDQLLDYLHHCLPEHHGKTFRIEDLEESSLICLLQCISGRCDMDRISDLFSNSLNSDDVGLDSDIVKDKTVHSGESITMDAGILVDSAPVKSQEYLSPPSIPQTLYRQVYASRFPSVANDTPPANTNTPVSPTPMEAWQLQIMEKLDQQHDALLKCQAQMDALAQLMTALIDASNPRPIPMPTRTKEASPPLSNRPPPPTPKMVLLSLFETWIMRLISFPRVLYSFIHSLRLVRFITHIQKEADRQNIRWIQFPLIFKILFASFIFSARMKILDHATERAISGGILVTLWKRWRLVIFVAVSVGIYFFKTGIASLLYKVLVHDQVLERIWRDEDVHPMQETSDETNKNDPNHGMGRRGQRDRTVEVEPVPEDTVLRRNGVIRRVRPKVSGETTNPTDTVRPRNERHRRNGRVRFIIKAIRKPIRVWKAFTLSQFQQGFLGGNIQPRIRLRQDDHPHRQLMQLYKDVISDCVYLIGSFFLSLFPTWQPRAYHEAQHRQGDEE